MLTTTLTCDMERCCTQPVTHIGTKGYVYCAEHAVRRRESARESTRALRQWELTKLRNGEQLTNYKPKART